MATDKAQRRWRGRNRLVKTQLNVMARKETHDTLQALAAAFDLRGKAEAVTFACFLARGLMQRATYHGATKDLLDDLRSSYHRDRDLHAP